ncbi:hypothetical protein SERLADRAFT_437660 [Serpula lacrymans var. lacrymans S7.9]|uniref:Uncharacterized protein n=1 Tax=Serpula lacrymans var. lacrymans (strain S7.9) TaxID=578457 RepID=F8NUT4_SERL9|nr:uncharacterized protein SERLADRAFT_437660 [Serpula lacrymans var. lacrymans S7.9]EGO25942.1 hypothetical protein SERLADRAFT_437660 [Serpula lacrymans var. lacrymans S7.9]
MDEEHRSLEEFHHALNNRDLHIAVSVNAAMDPQPAHSSAETEYYEDSSAASSPISELEGLVLAVDNLAFEISQLRQYVALTSSRELFRFNSIHLEHLPIEVYEQRILEPPRWNDSEERRALRQRAAEHKTALLILSNGISPHIYHLQNYVKTPQLAFSPEQDGREIHYLLPCGIIIHRQPYSAPYLESLTPYLEPSRIDVYVTVSFDPTPLEPLFTRIGIYETDLIKFYREIPFFFDLPLTPEQNDAFNPRDYLKTGVHLIQGNVLIERTPSPDEATSNLDSNSTTSSQLHGKVTLVAEPFEFKGEKERFIAWRQALQLYLTAYASYFPDEKTKLIYLLSKISDQGMSTVKAWKENVLTKALDATTPVWPTLSTVLTNLAQVFRNPNKRSQAVNEIEIYKQENKHCDEFFSHFTTLMDKARYEATTHFDMINRILKKNLHS